ASASRARAESASVRPEVQTPVESRSIVRTLRRAAGFETYVGSVTGTGSHMLVSRSPAGASGCASTAGVPTTTSASSTVSGSTTGRQARSFLTINRQATSQASRSPAGAATYAQAIRPSAQATTTPASA